VATVGLASMVLLIPDSGRDRSSEVVAGLGDHTAVAHALIEMPRPLLTGWTSVPPPPGEGVVDRGRAAWWAGLLWTAGDQQGDGVVKASLDGRRWTEMFRVHRVSMSSIAAGPQGIAVAGYRDVQVGSDALLWVSLDGRSWDRIDASGGVLERNARATRVVEDRDGFLVLGARGRTPAAWSWQPPRSR
jgi:hypothetical protein